jgi:hypothetical protein
MTLRELFSESQIRQANSVSYRRALVEPHAGNQLPLTPHLFFPPFFPAPKSPRQKAMRAAAFKKIKKSS